MISRSTVGIYLIGILMLLGILVFPEKGRANEFCYEDNDVVTLQGIANSRVLMLKDGELERKYVFSTFTPHCVAEDFEGQPGRVTHIARKDYQIIGASPPLGIPLELRGALQTGNYTQDYAVSDTLTVSSGRKLERADLGLPASADGSTTWDNPGADPSYKDSPAAKQDMQEMARLLSDQDGNQGAGAASASGACTASEIGLKNVRMGTNGSYQSVLGEVHNGCAIPVGIGLQMVVKNSTGQLLGTETFWPASTNNIGAGADYPFSSTITNFSGDLRVSLRIVDIQVWKDGTVIEGPSVQAAPQ